MKKTEGSGSTHWSKEKEIVKSNRSLKFLMMLVDKMPLPMLLLNTVPVAFFFYLFGPRRVRDVVLQYQTQLIEFSNRKVLKHPNVYRQILSFSECVVEKMAAWAGKLNLDSVTFHDDSVVELKRQLADCKGAVLIASHIGNMELLRCLASYNQTDVQREVPVAAIMETDITLQFNNTLRDLNPRSQLDIVSPVDIDIGTMAKLQDIIDEGGLVVVAADRTSASSPGRSLEHPFLGKQALFPYGSFLLASLLNAPIYFVTAVRQKTFMLWPKYNMFVTKAATSFDCSRKERMERIDSLCKEFIRELERYCERYPYQWYNFFDFWAHPEPDQGKIPS
ncbi:MAG: hypothetical protein J1D88_01860 [Treponema sp.]|nr:hypothetical protein [Treponema sp.]